MTDDLVARQWGEWVSSMGEWHVFGGLTYDPQRTPVGSHGQRTSMPHPEAVQRHVRTWLQESGRRLGRPVEAAIVAVESHKSGWPHCHPLVRLAGGLQRNDLVVLGQTWFERHGYARLEPPRDIADVAAYAAKYLSKDVLRGDILIWPQRGAMNVHQLGQHQVLDGDRRRARGGPRSSGPARFRRP